MKEKEKIRDDTFAIDEDELDKVSGGGIIFLTATTTIACKFCGELFECKSIEDEGGTICPHCSKRQR